MTSVGKKRKATSSLEESTKRLQIEQPSAKFCKTVQLQPIAVESSNPLEEEDEEEEEDHRGEYEFSDEDISVDTPVTPFSPQRRKFPSELKTIKCTYEGCTKTFNRPARLVAHLRSHTNERPFVCTYEGCDKSYLQDKHLQHHIKSAHTKEREFRCDWEGCGKGFLTSTRLKRHKEAHEGQERFRCTAYPPCNQTFRKHQTLQRHIRSDHLQLTPHPCTYVDSISGAVCAAGFDGATGLRLHQERVHGEARFFCPQCTIPGVFATDGSPIRLGFHTDVKLQAHIRKEHADCLYCPLKFSSRRELLQHIESQHSGKTLEERKNIPCTYAGCGKKFTKQNNLNTHIRTAHLGERFICGTFDVANHRDVPSFTSDLECGDDFVSKQSLVDHIRTAHLGLSTIINRKKISRPLYSDVDTDDGEDWIEPPRQRRKRTAATAIDHLIGTSQAVDPDRNISCPIPDCDHLFIRQYDLQIHLRSAVHNPKPSSFAQEAYGVYPEIEIDPALLGPGAPVAEGMEEDHADIEWELQRRAAEGGAFWVGAEDGSDVRVDRTWKKDEGEMRRLID